MASSISRLMLKLTRNGGGPEVETEELTVNKAAPLCPQGTTDSWALVSTLRFFFLRFSGPSSFVDTGRGAPIGRNLPIFFAFSSFSTSADGIDGIDPFLTSSRRRFRS